MSPFEQKIEEEWEQFQIRHTDERYPNIMLMGVSGAGKSSLINAVFGGELAPVSDTRPETQGYCTVYRGRDHGMPVNLIDTAGYELGQSGTYYGNIRQTIADGFGQGPVHVVWYCVPVTNEHVQPIDVETLRQLGREPEIRRRTLVVFTKCDQDTETSDKAAALAEALRMETGLDLPMFETSALPEYPLELPRLIQSSAELFDDEDLRRNFVAAQTADLDAKRSEARTVVGAASAAAALIGAVPIPFPDAALLVPTQVGMVATIVDIYGIRNLAAIGKSAVGNIAVSQVGKGLAAGLLKLIPVVGPWIGGTINATVASAITYAIGTAASELCYTNVRRALAGEPVLWSELFDSPEFLDEVKTLFVERTGR